MWDDPRSRPLDAAWIRAYEGRRSATVAPAQAGVAETPEAPPEPHDVQQEALAALAATRVARNGRALVVMATGLGKTWLAAFDVARQRPGRVLFVAHREEILRQARVTFRRILPEASLGLFTGTAKDADADVLFASIQTLGRAQNLAEFATDAFDYVVVDEFHHAAAATYRRVLGHFEPAFLLGLTATPERADGGDLLALCDHNLAFRCDLAEGIRRGLLAPFSYYGVPDDVDYAQIPWRSTRFDEEELTRAVATEARAANALDNYRRLAREHGARRALVFCCSVRHADFMADFLDRHGVPALAVHSGPTTSPREQALEALAAGEVEALCAVDVFNEGLDVPEVDAVVMLRPTASPVVWLQQLGRGLRLAKGKQRLRVIDYIGNHRVFRLSPETLLRALGHATDGQQELREKLEALCAGELALPPGCEATYELEAQDVLRSILVPASQTEALRTWYQSFRERHGRRPTASEAFHSGYSPRAVRPAHHSWLHFVDAMGDLSDAEAQLVRGEGAASKLLVRLHTTQMTKSYKMLVLLGMLELDRLPGEVTADELAPIVARRALRSAAIRDDFGNYLTKADDEVAGVRQCLVRYPLDR